MAGQQELVPKNLVAGTVGDDAPSREDHGALAELGGERRVVRDDQHRAVDPVEHLPELAAGAGSRLAVGSSRTRSSGCGTSGPVPAQFWKSVDFMEGALFLLLVPSSFVFPV